MYQVAHHKEPASAQKIGVRSTANYQHFVSLRFHNSWVAYKSKKEQVIDIVQAGTNQMYPSASPKSAETEEPIADTTGMGQKERP